MRPTLSQIGPAGCRAAFERWIGELDGPVGAGALLPYTSWTMHASLAHLAEQGVDWALPETAGVPSLASQIPEMAPHQLLVIEAGAAVGLKTALELAQVRGLWPILGSRLQFHRHGCFGDPLTAALLLCEAPQVGVQRGWCLLLDARRSITEPLAPGIYANPHELGGGDLPTGQDLLALGITEVHMAIQTGNHPDEKLPTDLRDWIWTISGALISVRFQKVSIPEEDVPRAETDQSR